jgi:hypothetical protein
MRECVTAAAGEVPADRARRRVPETVPGLLAPFVLATIATPILFVPCFRRSSATVRAAQAKCNPTVREDGFDTSTWARSGAFSSCPAGINKHTSLQQH